MSNRAKIAIVGDFNFTYNTHHATNLALDHAAQFLDAELSYYWIKLAEAAGFKNGQWKEYDGVWISPAPYKSEFLLNAVIESVLECNLPVLVTGDGFKAVVEVFIQRYQLNPNNEKLLSDNLIHGVAFQEVQVHPHSAALEKLYAFRATSELTSSRFSLYPRLIDYLVEELIDVEAYNQFEEIEVFSLKKHPFFLVSAFVPQITSTRDMPHPMVYTFIKACGIVAD